jgi:hypothetical protein
MCRIPVPVHAVGNQRVLPSRYARIAREHIPTPEQPLVVPFPLN